VKNKVLVIDIGGSHVKLMISRAQKRKFKSGPKRTPREMIAQMKPLVMPAWEFDVVAIGFPSPVRDGKILSEPKNLGHGWVGFNFESAAQTGADYKRCRCRRGSYHGGRMLLSGSEPGWFGAGWGNTVLPLGWAIALSESPLMRII
jgi:polyphosphate glucokinase